MSCINRLNCGEVLRASRSYNGVGNDKRECGTNKVHTIKILGIGLSSMEVAQTQRNLLTDNADEGRSETIILHRLYSPNRIGNITKVTVDKDIGTVILVLRGFMVKLDIMKQKMKKLKTEFQCNKGVIVRLKILENI